MINRCKGYFDQLAKDLQPGNRRLVQAFQFSCIPTAGVVVMRLMIGTPESAAWTPWFELHVDAVPLFIEQM